MPDESRLESFLRRARALPPEERGAFLVNACRDDAELRAQVDAILGPSTGPDGPPLDETAFHDLVARTSREPVDHIGRYRIIETVGEGGMGVVYRAEDPEAHREVALKVIKPGMDSKQILARFDAEKNALSLMDHANIARVYDSGQTPEGRPFFVLEYVKGTPLTEYCARERLPLEARLRLFQQICEGVQHAHTKSVVHRDLKPANILVTRVDGKSVPKIIDFGLAKALGARLTDMTMVSLQRQVMGTLEYMSPEQAGSGGTDVDTRTDVYALGVILYELLVDRRPFNLRDRAEDEVFRIIREEDPPRPSIQLSKLSQEESTVLAKSRGLDTGRLRSRLQGELDWIVLKALDKQRDRRYPTPLELAADIERYLGGSEPVIARPPSAIYKLRKFSRRYRGALVATGLVITALVAGMSWAWVERERAEEERKRADAKATEAKTAQSLAEARLDEITRLSDMKRLANAIEAAEDRWPAHPDQIDALDAWLRVHAAPLRVRLPEHRDVLARLREGALDYDEAQQLYDRETHPRRGELIEAQAEREQLADSLRAARGEPNNGESSDRRAPGNWDDKLMQQLDDLDANIDALEAEVSIRRTWKFADTDRQWEHDTLAELVRDLEIFVDPNPKIGTVASVEERLAFARNIAARSIRGPAAAAAWERTLAEVRRSDKYDARAKALKPQLDLFPLGPDPVAGYQEFLHLQTHAGQLPERDADGQIPLTRETGIIFVLIPGGTFFMGAQSKHPENMNYDPLAENNESPVREIALDPFFLSKYEMTQGQWARFTGANPSRHGPHENEWTNPVEQVSWDDCRRILGQLGLELPTEAQWEFSARAGTDTPWWCGREKESIGVTQAGNLSDARSRAKGSPTSWRLEQWEDDWIFHAPVGRFAPNGFGLHDVIGNVWEWCRDPCADYAINPAPGDGERSNPGDRFRVLRGGCFSSGAAYTRSAERYDFAREFLLSGLGVRPAKRIR